MPEHLRLLVRSFIVSLHVQLWKRRFALVVVVVVIVVVGEPK
jgi:hypothetical protein